MLITESDELSGIIGIYVANKILARPNSYDKLEEIMDGSISEFITLHAKAEERYSDIKKSREHNINNYGNLYDDDFYSQKQDTENG